MVLRKKHWSLQAGSGERVGNQNYTVGNGGDKQRKKIKAEAKFCLCKNMGRNGQPS